MEEYKISQSLRKVDQQIRIENLKEEVKEIVGGKMVVAGEISGDVEEGFWQHVLKWEKAPYTTYFKKLLQNGFEFFEPEKMDEAELNKELWKLIHKLAQMRVFLHSTNHLSDFELYTKLCLEVLHEDVKDLPSASNSAFHIDLAGSGSEEDMEVYLKFYAGEIERELWQNNFPDEVIPEQEESPYSRDQFLPKAYSGSR